MAGLSTPLHLASSLLALFAAAGLALVVAVNRSDVLQNAVTDADRDRARPGAARYRLAAPSPTLRTWTVAAALLCYAVGHGLAGALVDGSGQIAAWLRVIGLVFTAIGLSPPGLARMVGPAVVVPIVPPVPALLGALGGALGGLRLLAGGRRTMPVAIGLFAWGAAEALTQVSATGAALATLGGALAVGAFLWSASGSRLLAKFVTAFVTSLLAVVLLMAGVLSGLGSRELVQQELGRLQTSADALAQELGVEWPAEAESAVAPLATAVTLTQITATQEEQLQRVAGLFGRQDFFVMLTPSGSVSYSFAQDAALRRGTFALSVAGSQLANRLLAGSIGKGNEVVTVGGQVVAIGGIRITDGSAQPNTPALGILLAGRVADNLYAGEIRAARGIDVIIEVGGQTAVASSGVNSDSKAIAERLGSEDGGAAVSTQNRTLYAADAAVIDPGSQAVLGRVITVSDSDVIAQLERAQGRQLFLLALVGAIIAGTAAGLVTRRLTQPIQRLTLAAAAVREGRLNTQADVATRDEVGELGRTFNEMTTSLVAQSGQLRDAAEVQARLGARLEALTSSMSDGLVAVDGDGKIITFNPAAQRLTERDATDVIGLPLEEVLIGVGPGDRSAGEAVGAPLSEEVIAVQLLLERADGRFSPTAVTAAPVRDGSGTVLGRVCVLRDVTREAEVERMKSEFLSNVSHELRTPLTPIKGYADLLARRDVDPASTKRFAKQILESTGRLERIVAMIVDFAGLDSGRIELRREPTALGDVIGDTVAQWRRRYPKRDFRRRVPRDLPLVVVDNTMLRRALDELLDNAVKFSPGGEPISISASVDPPGLAGPIRGAAVRLSVKDRGVGIETGAAAGVFADFYQGDGTETRHYGGLGLGLALVRRIIEGFGGGAEVESEVGVGTTVHLFLPVAVPPSRQVAGQVTGQGTGNGHYRN